MIQIILILIFCVIVIALYCMINKLIKKASQAITTFTSIAIDKDVDEICNKAVTIAEYRSHEEKIKEKDRQQFAFDQSCSIVADVLLLHGLNAKNYNIQGLVLLAQHRQGIIALSQYQKEEEQKTPPHT